MMKKIVNTGTLSILVIIAFILAAITGTEEYTIFASIGGAVATAIPWGLIWLFKWKIAAPVIAIYVVFLYFSIYLGEARNFYYTVPHFDTALHVFSGGALVLLGLYIYRNLNPKWIDTRAISPIIAAVIMLCFSTTLGVVWEIMEFVIDAIFDANAQKYMLQCGTPLIGRAALIDTMKDLIANMVGALVAAALICIPEKQKEAYRLSVLRVSR